jgi:tRNA C32,U32 (ribose-2'-O)-methylase TrmJ
VVCAVAAEVTPIRLVHEKSTILSDDAQASADYQVQATPDAAVASAAAVQGMLTHWENALTHIGFLDHAAPKKLMPRLNQLFNRADLREEEIHILRGVAKAMLAKPIPENAVAAKRSDS